MKMNLKEIAEQCLRDSDEWFPNRSRDPEHHIISVTGEWGEFCNVVKKLQRGSLTLEQALPMMREELIDTFIYMFNLAAVMGVDIEREYNDKREQNRVRFAPGKAGAAEPGVRPGVSDEAQHGRAKVRTW
jgi:NTP pyrophosphatase (non-canonical NTP hydrolase)